MKFAITMTSSLDGQRQDKEMTEEQLTGLVGSYVVSRAKENGQTNTTIIIKGTSYKMQIAVIKQLWWYHKLFLRL